MPKRENEYRDRVRWTLQDYGITLWPIADGYQVANGVKFSTPRFVDMFGLNSSGRHVSCELKLGTKPLPSKFTDNERDHLSTVEKSAGVSMIVCINAEAGTMSCFGWNDGEFIAISSMTNLPMRKESV